MTELFVRVEAGPDIGWGHFMRCFAVAQAWKDLGHAVHFVCAALPEILRARLQEEGLGAIVTPAIPYGCDDAETLAAEIHPVSYTHLTLPTKRIV